MKVYTKVVLDWDGNVLEEEGYEYEGPVAQAGGITKAVGSLLGGGDDKSSGTQNTTQTVVPWSEQQPYLKEIFGIGQDLYQNDTPQAYPGQTIASLTPVQLAAQSGVLGQAGDITQTANQAELTSRMLMNPDFLTADSNPYMADNVQAALNPIWKNFYDNMLPSINGGAMVAGQSGSDRHGIAQQGAMYDTNKLAFDTSAKMYNDMYKTNLDSMLKTMAMNPALLQSQLIGPQAVAAVGDQNQAQTQAILDQNAANYYYNENAPWDAAAAYQSLVQGNYGGTGSSVSTGSVPGASTGQSLVQAAGTGLQTYATMNSIAGAMAGTSMAGVGASIGAASPYVAAGMALLSLF